MKVTVRPDAYNSRGGLRPWWARPLFAEPRSDSGGQGNKLKLGKKEIDYIVALNRERPDLLQWMVKETKDAIYLTGEGKWNEVDNWFWPMIAIGYNCLEVYEEKVKGKGGWFYKVIGLPIQQAPYGIYNFENWPCLVQRIYTNANGKVRDTGRGVGFMPIFDPSKFGKGTGLYILESDTIPYDPIMPIPLPPDYDSPMPDEPEIKIYRTLTQVQMRSEPRKGVGRRRTLGAGREFGLRGTAIDKKGNIWGHYLTNWWLLLYDSKRKMYLTTWRMA